LASQFAMADKSSFSNFLEASLGLNLRMAKAISTCFPLTKSATRRIFLGEVGQLLSLAIASCFFSSFNLSAICLLRTPIAYLLFSFVFGPRMSPKGSCGRKFPKLVTYHVLGHIHGNKLFSVVHRYGLSHKIRGDHRGPGPSFDHGLLT